jgi:uncharacterized membrane protein
MAADASLSFKFLRSSAVRKLIKLISSAFVAGLLVIAPVYLGCMLLLKAVSSLAPLLKPFTGLLPDWMPGAKFLSLLLVLVLCVLIGLWIRTSAGLEIRKRLERSVFEKIPGYSLIRDLTQRLAGVGEDKAWKPALAEIEDALVPAFIIEELTDGRYTVFVPSVPTPLAGAVYILSSDRVHPLNVSFTQAVMTVSRWGSGCKDLVAAMDGTGPSGVPTQSLLPTHAAER